jgi:TonB family protein
VLPALLLTTTLCLPARGLINPQQTQSNAPAKQAPSEEKSASPPQAAKSGSGDENVGVVHVTKDKLTGGGLIRKVNPVYPEMARKKGIAGNVKLMVTIGTDGQIHDVQPVSGPKELVPAAIEAVKQWLYNPFLMDGKPVEVRTDINVKFAP